MIELCYFYFKKWYETAIQIPRYHYHKITKIGATEFSFSTAEKAYDGNSLIRN